VRRQPRPVVFDSTARLPQESRLVAQASEVGLVVVVSRAAPRAAVESLQSAGAEVVTASGENEPARVADALTRLGELETPITSMMLEGGPQLAGAFLDAGEIDEARFFIAPMLLGGASARDPLEGVGAGTIADATRAIAVSHEQVGDDILVRARLKEW
jgi:diaminohydroxyphosphoribosylaminopyrimidine deaminase/5-amino-6-(5-phosphoribosylamino)uracil reductase